MVKTLKKLSKAGVIATALAQLQEEKVKEATAKLKDLYSRRDKAKKVLRNIERDIEDYLHELEIDEQDFEKSID